MFVKFGLVLKRKYEVQVSENKFFTKYLDRRGRNLIGEISMQHTWLRG